MPRRGENIRKRKDGRWEGRYSYKLEDGSKSKVRSVYSRYYHEVKKKLAEAKKAAETAVKEKGDGRNILFTDAAGEWLGYVESSKKYSTYIKYRRIYTKYLEEPFKSRNLDLVTKEYVESHVFPNASRMSKTGELSDSLEKSICCVVNQILAYAARKYRITVNTIIRSRKKTVKKPVQIFNMAEQKKLTEYLKQDMDLYKFGILLCLFTGLRIGELCALKWSDINMDSRIIRVTSTIQRLPVPSSAPGGQRTMLIETDPKSLCSRREIPICDLLYEHLAGFQHNGTYVIGESKPADPRTCQKKLAKYLREAGIEYRCFHTLRHTFASNCIAHGTDPKALSEMLGHSSVQITLNRYVHPSMLLKMEYLNLLCEAFRGQERGQAG